MAAAWVTRMDELTLLRLHVEAVWRVRLPTLVFGDVELPPDGAPPAWLLYTGVLDGGTVRIWRQDAAEDARASLAARADAALALPPGGSADADIRCEVALTRRGPALPVAETTARLVRRIGAEDAALLDAFEPGEAEYYLAPERAPVFGAIVDGKLLSVAHSSRRTAEACELGVETLTLARRRGYGLAVTLRWADAVETEGLTPLYSALATNAASLALAASAGYVPFVRAAYLPCISSA